MMRIGKYTDSMMIANADGRFPARATATPRIGHSGIAPSTTLDRRAFAQGIVLGSFIQGAGAVVILWGTYRNRGGEPVDAVREAGDRGQVVLVAHIVILAPVPIVTALIAYWEWRSLNNRSEAAPFIGAVCLFMMSYLGIAISLWPMIVPCKFTLREAASSASTQAFLLVGTVFLLPIILCTPAGHIGCFGARSAGASAITDRRRCWAASCCPTSQPTVYCATFTLCETVRVLDRVVAKLTIDSVK